MPEQQPTNKCPHCGYPVETKEHAPDCPNAGLPEVEAAEKDKAGSQEQEYDLDKLLNERIYPELGITQEDENRYAESVDYSGKHEALKRVDKVSFNNIRESIKLFFEYNIQKGIPDMKAYTQKKAEVLQQVRVAHGFSANQNINWKTGQEIDAEVSRKVGAPLVVHFEAEDLIKGLQQEFERVRSNNAITFNASFETMEKIIKSGKIIPMTEQPEDQRVKMRKTMDFLGIGSDEEYDERRHESEEIMGIKTGTGPQPVYTALAGGSRENVEQGAAPQYGDHIFIF